MNEPDAVKEALANGGHLDLGMLQWTREPQRCDVQADTIIVTILTLLFYKVYYKPEAVTVPGGQETIKQQLAECGEFTTNEKKSLVFFLIALVLWLTNAITNIHVAHVALGVATLAMFPGIGCLDFRSTLRNINWAMIMFVIGVLSIAGIMTDGCNMGVKSLNRYLNQYEAAEEYAKDITKRLINLEQKLTEDVRAYL